MPQHPRFYWSSLSEIRFLERWKWKFDCVWNQDVVRLKPPIFPVLQSSSFYTTGLFLCWWVWFLRLLTKLKSKQYSTLFNILNSSNLRDRIFVPDSKIRCLHAINKGDFKKLLLARILYYGIRCKHSHWGANRRALDEVIEKITGMSKNLKSLLITTVY